MKKLPLIIAAVLGLLLVSESFTAEDPSLTLVVGNCRRAGGVKKSYADLVEQDRADFTHTQSFQGRVISVDICPLQACLDYPHITLDFANESPKSILSKLNTPPSCMFFEWFPSCITQTPGKNMTPLLLPALKNAFAILPPGGKLIIDHHPYVLSLPNSSADAFKTLLGGKVQVNNDHLHKATTSVQRLSECGILSHFLQIADPFTLHFCLQEKVELRDYLMFRVKNGKTPYNDDSCQFIRGKCEDISKLVTRLASTFPMEMEELMIRISNGILYANQGIKEDEQGYWDLFEQHYYMKTRGPLILETLQSIGFVLENDPIQYHKRNPYNKRKHAWLISATKPTQTRETTGGAIAEISTEATAAAETSTQATLCATPQKLDS